jgi:bifunctional NMN adenylyltransferase/nudix hydrolase
MLVDDWRYKGERNKIVTSLFTASYIFGNPQPDDDISELRWFNISSDIMNEIVEEHKPLMAVLLKNEFNIELN